MRQEITITLTREEVRQALVDHVRKSADLATALVLKDDAFTLSSYGDTEITLVDQESRAEAERLHAEYVARAEKRMPPPPMLVEEPKAESASPRA